jgi:glycosyltransferase involved in cell wall biosynthesis
LFSPYCVDVSAFRPAESERGQLRQATRSELGLADEHLALLFSGKLVARKGPDLLLRVVKRLSADLRRRVVVLFLGDGELREPLRELAGIEPCTEARFLGFQNQHALSRYYHAADLMVLPSRESETWGLVVNEALHHGIPCVVSDRVGSAPDLIESGITGEVFTAGSEQSLTGALERAVRWRGSPEMRERCRRGTGSGTYRAVVRHAGGVCRLLAREQGQLVVARPSPYSVDRLQPPRGRGGSLL